MKLKKVKIKNFRSIKSEEVNYNISCRIFVGKNEAGKTNLLHAISLLDPNTKVKPQDIREPLPDEGPIEEAYVRFVFELDTEDIVTVYDEAASIILSLNDEIIFSKRAKNNITLYSLCLLLNEGLYHVNLKNNERSVLTWKITKNYKILKHWKKPSSGCPDDYTVEDGKGNTYKIKKYSLIDTENITGIAAEYVEDVDLDYILGLIKPILHETVSSNLPTVVFWEYSDDNLLPPKINIANFSANPDTCIPLRNMFVLAGYRDISEKIAEAKDISENRLSNLLDCVADRATKHFRNIWKEYKTIEFNLRLNADSIDANIRDFFNKYEFLRRSEGFRRFVTFLLLISAQEKTDNFNNCLLIIDEPGISLHPSGSRYLRDELLRISKNNTIVFSTHSIFMIDGDNIARHYLVQKDKEITEISEIDDTNFVDEEVIYNALGCSIFDILSTRNILFEGWRDKKLFQTAFSSSSTAHKKLIKKFEDIGLCHAKGVKQIRSITPFLEMAKRECIIISDSDAPAIQRRKEYLDIHGYGSWKMYSELYTSSNVVTAEDFIKTSTILKALNQIKKEHVSLNESVGETDIKNANCKINGIKNWLIKCKVNATDQKELMNKIKTIIYINLRTTSIETFYYEFMKELAKYMGL